MNIQYTIGSATKKWIIKAARIVKKYPNSAMSPSAGSFMLITDDAIISMSPIDPKLKYIFIICVSCRQKYTKSIQMKLQI